VHSFSDLKLAVTVVFIWAADALIDHWQLILYSLTVPCAGYLLRRAMEVFVDDRSGSCRGQGIRRELHQAADII
jgi:hypothetical protein